MEPRPKALSSSSADTLAAICLKERVQASEELFRARPMGM